jgi:hypothetical protein
VDALFRRTTFPPICAARFLRRRYVFSSAASWPNIPPFIRSEALTSPTNLQPRTTSTFVVTRTFWAAGVSCVVTHAEDESITLRTKSLRTFRISEE